MKNKKLLSTLMAGALAISQMGLPAYAATGTVTVDIDTMTGVVRVEVPTALEVAVDEFELDTSGTQIYSGEFDITNKSEMAVQVDVDSVLTKDTGVTLSSTKKDVDSDTSGAKAWIAAAAQTSDGKYIETANKTIADLDDTSTNVATFGAADSKADQKFYLQKGTSDAKYVYYDDTKGDVPQYAEFYELTALADQDGDNDVDGDDAIAQAKTSEVYAVAKADGNAVTVIEPNSEITALPSGVSADTHDFYTKAAAASASVTKGGGKKYVYKEMSTAGGAAAFRYIGKLAEGGTWNDTKLSTIKIDYTINGITGTKYDSVKDDCTYGLYTAPAAPSIEKTSYTLTADEALEIEVDLGAGSKAATKVTSVAAGDTELMTKYVTYDDGVLTMGKDTVNFLLSNTSYLPATLKVKFNDTAETTVDIELDD